MTSIFNDDQIDVLLRPIRASRVATRKQGGRDLSYVEAYEIRAHLIRLFGFGGFDLITESCDLLYQRDVKVGKDEKPGWEVAYKAHVTLRIDGDPMIGRGGDCKYSEVAVGSSTGSVGLGDLHDNAAKSAVSDAVKRCAINLGTQFGLSLYDNGNKNDIVRSLIGREAAPVTTPEQDKQLAESLGAKEVDTTTGEVK